MDIKQAIKSRDIIAICSILDESYGSSHDLVIEAIERAGLLEDVASVMYPLDGDELDVILWSDLEVKATLSHGAYSAVRARLMAADPGYCGDDDERDALCLDYDDEQC